MKTKIVLSFLFSSFLFLSFAQDSKKVYQNYDFVPGDKILFEDNFTETMDGEFPALWKLKSGQGVVNKEDGQSVFIFTDGNYAIAEPRIKTKEYLDDAFTVECDYYSDDGDVGFGIVIIIGNEEHDLTGILFDNVGSAHTHYFPEGIELHGKHPEADNFETGKWRHIAIAYKKGQMKCYVDQHRVLVIPQVEYQPRFVAVAGVALVKLKNFRLAIGGGMNMLDKLFKEGRIVTHGILFDVGKATLKPHSYGVINEIAKLLEQNPDIKLSIEGHTDSDGNDASNQKLSEERAAAVKNALIELKIDGSRLETKGWGESKPIDDNSKHEGKANNRRVEFVKI